MALTDEQKRKYIDQDGVRCPACNSGNMDLVDIEYNVPVVADVKCNDCGKEFREEYAMVDVREM